MKATVYKSTGSWYVVKVSEGQEQPGQLKTYNARILGKFKIEGLTSTNPIAVGDIVHIDSDVDRKENESEVSLTITSIEDRKN